MYFTKRLIPSVTRSDLLQSLPDILEPGLSVVFCGINPGVSAASTGRHFAGRSNRFWRAVHLAGFTPEQICPKDDRTLLQYGCGLTTVVSRPTARADELSQWEFKAAATEFERKIERYAPQCVAFLGKMALCAMSGRRDIHWGLQPTPFGGARAWVLPNPSGLNRTFSLDALVTAYRELRLAVAPAGQASRTRTVDQAARSDLATGIPYD
ncbi:G/U mismatch-specific DNA glycosylase [Paraburkholderia sp. GAS42]|uniref:G/U mismatch-specific DNA glycosylase n=1 Tax=Paraburkholderia sp. GAS42 TaxID=3035135 RepID=UPI003D21F488